ncbi:MAG: hypothetical protein H6825_07120 [Planctomycetes bacterium]|nr:hypothetical protein [Planctomycetota bacterium]
MNAIQPAAPPAPETRPLLVETRLLPLLELREGLEQALEKHVDEMREFAPELRVRRAFMGGRWVIGLHAGGRVGGTGLFSRLDFEIAVDVPGRELTVTSYSTVRMADGARREVSVSLDDEAPAATLSAFVESSLLEFAARYFER